MPLRLIPVFYIVASLLAGVIVPRLEHAYLAEYTHGMSVASALTFFSAVSSGMMALTGVVFAISFLVVQFSALAYSPRLVIMFASNPALFHTMGIFFATFTYSLVGLIWTDREDSGTVPFFSCIAVEILLIISMLAFVRLIRSVNDLQLHNVLQMIGSHGRIVIGTMFPRIEDHPILARSDHAAIVGDARLITQTLRYSGEPRVITSFDLKTLVRIAQSANGVIAIECGVGETVLKDTILMRVYGASGNLPEPVLMHCIRRAMSRTFEQDPKYAIRLLVDIAIRALSPAINDPTTAVQALDQIEDLLRRLGDRQLDTGYTHDETGVVRVTFPVPTWEDYMALSFDEIRQYGGTSIQIARRLRSALVGLSGTIAIDDRRDAVLKYLERLNRSFGLSTFDDQDQAAALVEDRQGLGLTRKPNEHTLLSVTASKPHMVP